MRTREGGFTLLETLIAIGLFAMVVLVFLGSIHYSLALNTYSKDRLVALNDVKRVIEQVRLVADSYGVTGAGSVLNPTTPWSNFISNSLPNESVLLVISGVDPLVVTATISWNEKSRTQNLSMSTKVTRR